MGNLSAIFEGGSHLSDFASLILLSPIFFLWCLFHVSQMHLPACTSFFLPSLLLPFFPYQVHNPSYRVQYQTNITFNVIFFLFPTRCSSIATFCFCYMYVAWKRKKKQNKKKTTKHLQTHPLFCILPLMTDFLVVLLGRKMCPIT